GDALYRRDDIAHRAARRIRKRAAMIDLEHGVPDECLDFLRGASRTLSEIANVRCHDAEAAAMLARARGFHRSIERENVRLEGDVFDLSDDALDFVRARFDRAHAGDQIVHDLATLRGYRRGVEREPVRLLRAVGGVANRC